MAFKTNPWQPYDTATDSRAMLDVKSKSAFVSPGTGLETGLYGTVHKHISRDKPVLSVLQKSIGYVDLVSHYWEYGLSALSSKIKSFQCIWRLDILMYFLSTAIHLRVADLQLSCNALEWRHNEPGGVSNHQGLDCLLNRLFSRRSQKTSKLHVTGLCAGNSTVAGEFPAQRASNAENVSIWLRHHGHDKIDRVLSG